MIISAEKASRAKGISEKKTIFIVDNNVINRTKLRNSLRLCGKYMIIGESQYYDFYEKISIFSPNILVLSSFQPCENFYEYIFKIRNDFPLMKLLIVTDDLDENDFIKAVNAGVVGYLSYSDSFESVANAIDEIINYGASYDKRLNKFIYRVINAMNDKLKPCHFDKPVAEQFSLTKRELEVASVMSDSSRYSDVARKLHISNDTVKMHMSHIYKKLGVSTKHEAILKLQSKILEFKLNSTV